MQTARTTIELDRELLKKAKRKALEEDKTLKEVISEILRKDLRKLEKKKKTTKKKIKIRTYHMGEIKGTLSREEIYDWL